MDLESFLVELRAARAAGIVFQLLVGWPGLIRADLPLGFGLCPLEVAYARRRGRMEAQGPVYMDRSTQQQVILAADNCPGADPALRAKLLEACGLAEQAPTP